MVVEDWKLDGVMRADSPEGTEGDLIWGARERPHSPWKIRSHPSATRSSAISSFFLLRRVDAPVMMPGVPFVSGGDGYTRQTAGRSVGVLGQGTGTAVTSQAGAKADAQADRQGIHLAGAGKYKGNGQHDIVLLIDIGIRRQKKQLPQVLFGRFEPDNDQRSIRCHTPKLSVLLSFPAAMPARRCRVRWDLRRAQQRGDPRLSAPG